MQAKQKKSILKYFIPPLLIILAVGIAIIFVKTKPTPKQKPRKEQAVLVETTVASMTSTQLVVQTTGTVIPAQQITLQARVGGEIIGISPDFEPGGKFTAGATMLNIDPTDYEIQRTARDADLARAQLEYQNELGMQNIAQHEWELLDNRDATSELEQDLVLRRPHLKKAKAMLESARAAQQKAVLDLERTVIKAPFDAIIAKRNVDLGGQVAPQTALATLVGTDEYWVNVTLPVDKLKWLFLPNAQGANGSQATIITSAGILSETHWTGQLIRMNPSLESKGRLAQLIVSIPRPLENNAQAIPLMLGSYVQVALNGRPMEKVFILPREWVKDGNFVWTMDVENRLHIQPVEISWTDRDIAIITGGLTPGTKLITSGIPAPAEGMLLRERSNEKREKGK